MSIWPWRKPPKPPGIQFKLDTFLTMPVMLINFGDRSLIIARAAAYHAARLAMESPKSRFEARGALPPHEGAIAFYHLPEGLYVEALFRGEVQSVIWPISKADTFLAPQNLHDLFQRMGRNLRFLPHEVELIL